MYVRLCVCVLHLFWRTNVDLYKLNNSPIGPPPRTRVKTSRRHNDVIAAGAHRVYGVLIIIFFISCRWVTQRGYPAVLCKNYVPFCLFILACLVMIVKNLLVREWCSIRCRHNDTRSDFKWNNIVFLLRKHINQVGYIHIQVCVRFLISLLFMFNFFVWVCLLFFCWTFSLLYEQKNE